MEFVTVRIVSGRGTDETVCLPVPEGYTEKEVAEDWVEDRIHNSPIEHVTVTYDKVTMPDSKDKLLEEWKSVCTKHEEARAERDRMLAIMNAYRKHIKNW